MNTPESLKKIVEIHSEVGSLINSYESACKRAEQAEDEINEAHTRLSKYVNKEHWSLAGRIEGLVGMIIRARKDGKLDETLDKIQDEYVKQFDGWTPEEVLKHV